MKDMEKFSVSVAYKSSGIYPVVTPPSPTHLLLFQGQDLPDSPLRLYQSELCKLLLYRLR